MPPVDVVGPDVKRIALGGGTHYSVVDAVVHAAPVPGVPEQGARALGPLVAARHGLEKPALVLPSGSALSADAVPPRLAVLRVKVPAGGPFPHNKITRRREILIEVIVSLFSRALVPLEGDFGVCQWSCIR